MTKTNKPNKQIRKVAKEYYLLQVRIDPIYALMLKRLGEESGYTGIAPFVRALLTDYAKNPAHLFGTAKH